MFAKFFRSKTRSQNRSQSGLSKKRSRSRLPRFEPLEERRLLSVVPVMVADINQDTAGGGGGSYTQAGDTTYMVANDGIHGQELWRTDGTEAGTWMVKDINPGIIQSPVDKLTAVGDTLYFRANDGTHGTELWKSDGSAGGTVMVADIRSGDASSSPNSLTVMGDTLYFRAYDETNGYELWKSDSTEAGTVPVKDIRPGVGSSYPSGLKAVGDTLYFTASDETNGSELWKSDGTEAGTVLVKDTQPGVGTSSPSELTAVGDTLYFVADDGTHGKELWKSDGTEAGTVMVKDVRPDAVSSYTGYLTAVGDTLYFRAEDVTNGTELWKSDGTEAGTLLVKDISSGPDSSAPVDLTPMEDTLYFVAHDDANGRELWKTDGTDAGTVLVKDILSGSGSASPSSLTAADNTLYFTAYDATHGQELWKSDGTEAGTVMIDDIWLGSDSSYPGGMTQIGDTLYFVATDDFHGAETWTLDLASGDVALLKDLRTTTESSSPYNLVEMGGTSYFVADDGVHGKELWASDGTTAGTRLVKDIAPGEASYSISQMASANGKLIISLQTLTTSGNDFWQMWASDGTTAGTVLLKDGFRAQQLTVFNDRVFFRSVDDPDTGTELWVTDGTEAGTVLFKDIRTGTASSNPQGLQVIGENLFFSATGDDGESHVWVTDGNDATSQGTHRFADSLLGSSFSYVVGPPVDIGGTQMFAANESSTSWDGSLWSASDGLGADATRLTGIDGYIRNLTGIDGKAIFSVHDTQVFPPTLELWTSEGTVETTEPITLLHEDHPYGVKSGNSIAVGDRVYFTVATAYLSEDYYQQEFDPDEYTLEELVEGYGEYIPTELWGSDGTAAGTHLVREFPQAVYDPENPDDYQPGERLGTMWEFEGQLFFKAYTPETGMELFTTDGTTTTLVADVRPGARMSSSPRILGAVDGHPAFRAYNSDYGSELWRLLDDTDPNVSPVVTLPSGTGTVAHVLRDGDDLVVEKGGTELLRSAMGSIAGVTIQGAPETEVIIVDIDGLNTSNLPNGLHILAGEDGTNDYDTLVLEGSTSVSNYAYTTGGPEAGTITLDGFTVNFEEFEPIIDQLNVTNRTFSIGTEESQKIVIGDDAGSDGYSMINDGGAGTFESLSFTSPTNSLAIVGGEGADEIIVTTMDDTFATPIVIEGGSGNDLIDASESDMPMFLSGGEGDDELLGGTVDDVLDGGAGNDVLDGGLGSDDVDGGTGNNEVISDVADGVVVLNEEGTFHLNATFVGFATADIDWGDGTSDTYDVVADTVTGSHVYPTKGDYTVVVAAPTSDAPEQTLTVYVTVNNVAPDVNAGDDQTIDEGGSVSLAGSFNDPGSFNGHTYVWDFGDGSPTVAGTLATDHVYVDNGTYTVTLSVADDESVGADSFTVTVNNVAPSLTLLADTVVVSQDTGGTNFGTYFDPGDDTVSLSASAGDLIDNGDGTWSWSFGATNDATLSQQVIITAEDSDGATRDVSFQLIVNTVQPGLADVSAGSTIAEDGLVTLSGQITDPGTFSTFELQCDWGDGNVETFSYAAGTGSFSETHQYESGGVFAVQVTLTDVYGGESTADTVARATGARVHDGVLQVVGTEDSDHVLIGNLWSRTLVLADFLPGFWHVARFTAADIESIEVFLGDGNDRAVVASSVSVPAKLDGGAGNDYLKGGRGDDILLGGPGKDLLMGNQGRDLMIGGAGRDRLVGNRDDDILIGGTTAHDADDLALEAIMAEWTSDRDYATRVDNLRGVGTGTKLNEAYYLIAADAQQTNAAATVFDDDERDVMTGGHGLDWFFANFEHDDEGRRDRITDLKATEFAEDLDWIETIEEVADPEG
jgi:ELWxxDGT repeat protein